MTQPPHQPGHLPDESRLPQGEPGSAPDSPRTDPQAQQAPQAPHTPQAPQAPQAAPGAQAFAGSGDPALSATGDPALSAPGAPSPGAPWPAGQPEGPPAKKSRKRLVVGLVAGVLALVGVGGVTAAVLANRNADADRGAASATDAVTEFMRATYRDRNHDRAAELVCGQALDPERLNAKIKEIEELAGLSGGSFSWTDPTVTEESEQTATVTTTVKMTTKDERVSHVDLRFVVVEKNKWLVCEVS